MPSVSAFRPLLQLESRRSRSASARFMLGGGFVQFALLFAFDGVVHRSGGVIGGGEASFLSFALRLLFLGFGDVFGQCCGFVFAQLRDACSSCAGSAARKLGFFGFDDRLRLVMWHSRSRRFHLRFDGGLLLPFRERLAGQRLEASRKRGEESGAHRRGVRGDNRAEVRGETRADVRGVVPAWARMRVGQAIRVLLRVVPLALRAARCGEFRRLVRCSEFGRAAIPVASSDEVGMIRRQACRDTSREIRPEE